MHAPHWLGIEGENIAARYLAGRDYRIIARNFRLHRNEIDIIATHKGVLCFIEVKTRASLDKGHPSEAVTLHKQKEIIRAASGFLATLEDPWITCRFDVVTILAWKIEEPRILEYELEHFEAAFMA